MTEGGFEAATMGAVEGQLAEAVGGWIIRRIGLLRGAARACNNSFDADTHVLLADGSTKPISEVREGDQVQATDPTTDETRSRTVLAVIVAYDTNLTDITITGPDGTTSVIHTTPMHPFWDESSQAWVYASGLDVGHRLRTSDGTIVRVAAVRSFTGTQWMYNLTIDRIHTYYVLVSDTPILVHNVGCGVEKWTSLGNLDDHFARHGKAMGFTSQAEYRYAAEDLMCVCGGRRAGVLIKRDGNTRYFLDPASGEFGVASEHGIVTYYRPENPMAHFNNQPGALVP